jgi:hypothetical protein
MIYECPLGHICFSKTDLHTSALKGCIKQTIILSPIDIEWFYKINKDGLGINKADLNMIIEDHNMLKDVKKANRKVISRCIK